MCLGNTILPFIAWWILPVTINFNLYFVSEYNYNKLKNNNNQLYDYFYIINTIFVSFCIINIDSQLTTTTHLQ